MSNNLYYITNEIEEIIKDHILENTIYDWKEEYIIRDILKAIRNEINNKIIDDDNSIYSIKFNIFQLDTTLNTTQKFGDVAFIVNTEFTSGEKIEGVGFIEAKIRNKKSNVFNSLKKEQLQRILKNAPHSLLLLLDYEPISKYNMLPSFKCNYRYPDKTYSMVTQINTALNLNSSTTSLYKISYPFAYQLTARYFYGLDLEYDKDIIQQVKGFTNKKEFPKFAVFLTITPVNKKKEEEIYINRNFFKEIE